MLNLAPITGGEYVITSSGFPVLPADPADSAQAVAADPSQFQWTINILSSKGKLQSRSNPGIDPIYLYVYATDVDVGLSGQAVYSIDLGTGGPTRNMGTEITGVTITASLILDQIRYASGVYDNLRLGLTPVTNVL